MTGIDVRRLLCLTLICLIVAALPASAQHFQQIPGSLTQIAVGRAEVWGLNGSSVYRFNASTRTFDSVSGSLTQIAVGGGSLLHRDEVWGVNASNKVFHYNFTTNTLQGVGGSLAQIAVGEGDNDNCHPYEVWGIGPGGNLWRYNYCTSKWEAHSNPPDMIHIAVSPSGVWGIDASGTAWRFSPDGYGSAQGATLQQIAVGVNDVWGVGTDGQLYRYDDVSGPNEFVSVCAGCYGGVGQVAAGGDGVWIVHTSLQGGFAYIGIARFTFSAGGQSGSGEFFNDQFSINLGPEVVAQIAAGSGGGVWAITATTEPHSQPVYQVYVFVRP